MIPEDSARAERRRVRSRWPIRRFDLGQEPSDDLRGYTDASERLAMVWPLTVAAWATAGRDIPDYRREDAPGVVHRAGLESSYSE